MRATVIVVVGGKKSGKTTTIEVLIRELAKRGYRVAAVKHIPEPDFTMDREGKDTWKFAQSGAKTVVGFSADEIATIEKIGTRSISIEEILQRCGDADVVFLEGFRKLIAQKPDILKIVAVKSPEEALKALKDFAPILAFTGPCSTENLNLKAPYVNVATNPEKMADLIEKAMKSSS